MQHFTRDGAGDLGLDRKNAFESAIECLGPDGIAGFIEQIRSNANVVIITSNTSLQQVADPQDLRDAGGAILTVTKGK